LFGRLDIGAGVGVGLGEAVYVGCGGGKKLGYGIS